MRNLLQVLLFSFFFLTTQAQVVITELSYNPPESMTDSLEYIELFNAGTQPVHLLKYKFSRGVEFTFPDITIAPNGYLVVCVKATSFEIVYGKTALQWTSGALSNNGERVTLTDSLNNELVDFTYANTAPWPTSADGTNGEGRSIELCNPTADPKLGANWKVSENDLSKMINGKALFGTPGAANSVGPCSPMADVIVEVSSFQFSPKDITIDVGQTVRWENKGGTHNVNGTQATFPNNPASFTSGNPMSGNWTYDFKFTIAGKYDYQCNPHASSGMTGTVTVMEEVIIDSYPLRTIASLKGNNASGVADSLGIKCKVEGVVHGINFRTGGLQFSVLDNANKGIGVFNNGNTLGYTVKEGDKIEVKGTVAQFRGLTQINADEIKLISGSQPLVAPIVADEFIELFESSLIVVQNVTFVDKSQWGMGTATGFNVDMTNGQTTFSIRIDNDANLFTALIPEGNNFNVTGLLSQFTTTTQPPFEGGYQLLPRYLEDFAKELSTSNNNLLKLKVFPNPTMDYINIDNEVIIQNAQVFDAYGRLVMDAGKNQVIYVNGLLSGVYKVVVRENNKFHMATFVKF
ncbi:MAG: lamin tail domain-containing protein [Saprospiraceae bacterium]|nr:lamin tail domain-containing protein [Saprospiraceae bacterium]